LGDGTTTTRLSPVQIGNAYDWSLIRTYKYHSAGIKTNGTLWIWGRNDFGQIGNGGGANVASPIQIGTDTWLKVGLSQLSTFAVRSDGTLWGCGQLPGSNTLVQIGTDNDWVDVDGGDGVIAKKSNGTLWTWGFNSDGILGQGNTTILASPTQMGTDTDWASFAMGEIAAFGIKTNGTLWGWGNFGGFVGVNPPASYSPNQIGTDTDWAEVTVSSGNAVMGRKTNGTIYTWGSVSGISLGDGVTFLSLTPFQVGTGTYWSQVSAGENHYTMLKNDGTLWGWGENPNGELGISSTINQQTPIQIGSSSSWSLISAGQFYTLALLSVSAATGKINTITNIDTNSAFVSIENINEGVSSITSKGLVWSTSGTPSIENNQGFVTSGSGTASFQSQITNLKSNTLYYVRAFFTNSLGTGYSAISSFITAKVIEDYAPNNGDGNGDGTLDSQQPNVHSLQTIDSNFVTIVSLDDDIIKETSAIAPIKDSRYNYPRGQVKFRIDRQKAKIKIYYHGVESLTNYKYRKVDAFERYYNLEDVVFSSEIVGGRIVATATFIIEDGSRADYDGIKNGVIIDPVGFALPLD
jgi:alpha-tubulin suppressor-like RCC1 family protein